MEEAQRRGLMGPGPIEPQLEHALGFGAAAGWDLDGAHDPGPGGPALDLGSGGGLPGLVLAMAYPPTGWVLLDSRERSAAFLEEATGRLGLGGRVSVVRERAEDVGRAPAHRGAYRLVVARGFGPPATTAECAAPMLEVGGRLVVSEPPEASPDRWAQPELATLGLVRVSTPAPATEAAHYVVLEQTIMCPSRFPRRVGLPQKRPLFESTPTPPEP